MSFGECVYRKNIKNISNASIIIIIKCTEKIKYLYGFFCCSAFFIHVFKTVKDTDIKDGVGHY